MDFLSGLTEGFSGADIAGLTQTAAKAAVREVNTINLDLIIKLYTQSIEADARRVAAQALNPNQPIQTGGDPVPEITRKHFEEALKHSRKSVTNVVCFINRQHFD